MDVRFQGRSNKCRVAWELSKLTHPEYIINVPQTDMSRDMRFAAMWYVRPAKAQTSLRVCAV